MTSTSSARRTRWGTVVVPVRGLTLIELLAVMAASTIIFFAALQGFRSGKDVYARTELRDGRARRLFDFILAMEADVHNAMILAGDDDWINWEGTDINVRFVSALPGGRPLEIAYRYAAADESHATGRILRACRFTSGTVPVGVWAEEVMLDGVESLRFQYAAKDGTESLVWGESFVNQEQLPHAVQVALQWQADDSGMDVGPPNARHVIHTRARGPANGQ